MRVKSGRADRGSVRGRTAEGYAEGARPSAVAAVSGQWLVRGKDGRLAAYARHADGVLRWTETRPGGPEWSGPDLFEVPHLTHLSLAQGADGYVHFLGRRSVPKGDGPPVVDVVHAIQYQSGRGLTSWHSLGNPRKNSDQASGLGAPVGVVGPTGLVHFFVRTGAGGVMLRRDDKAGVWGSWHNMNARGAEEGMAVTLGTAGTVDLLVPGPGVAMHWRQSAPNGGFTRERDIPVQMAPGSVTALATAPDRCTYYWTDPVTGGVVAHRVGGWLIPLGGAPAEGPVSVLRTVLDGYDCTVLAHRDTDGHVMLAACGTEGEEGGLWWSPAGERTSMAPALATDHAGRVVLASIGLDGALYIARQSPEPGLAMGPARRISH
ncbi:hypothetical protein ACWD7B_27130 [Streptomyces rubiginosohelvolus]|uniref:hypothetical protein n=1 Tax=Streptomyces TaxID=1883 RepID=UPI00190B8F53|nr:MULTISPECIES: hypothetical protein [unclassified Streptomyces]MBK3530971.1 hypothetical protein [Streptomyces sp. MBT72]MBK3536955.1 hypothetical protein [Streptomyces sp. MBT67]MBK3551904.1 hypothetical protein [Streptomyces sp. MBT61]MBK6030346.1 hypothetical protein [Streptomyces sp. MBT59]